MGCVKSKNITRWTGKNNTIVVLQCSKSQTSRTANIQLAKEGSNVVLFRTDTYSNIFKAPRSLTFLKLPIGHYSSTHILGSASN